MRGRPNPPQSPRRQTGIFRATSVTRPGHPRPTTLLPSMLCGGSDISRTTVLLSGVAAGGIMAAHVEMRTAGPRRVRTYADFRPPQIRVFQRIHRFTGTPLAAHGPAPIGLCDPPPPRRHDKHVTPDRAVRRVHPAVAMRATAATQLTTPPGRSCHVTPAGPTASRRPRDRSPPTCVRRAPRRAANATDLGHALVRWRHERLPECRRATIFPPRRFDRPVSQKSSGS